MIGGKNPLARFFHLFYIFYCSIIKFPRENHLFAQFKGMKIYLLRGLGKK